MFGKAKPEVLVAGAGPVGLFTALALTKRGVRVRIVDPHSWEAGHSYALALHAQSLAALASVGLREDVLARSLQVGRLAAYSGTERQTLADLPGQPVAVLPQSDLEGLLVQALLDRGVKVEWNHRLAACRQHGDQVEVTVHRLDQEGRGYGVAHVEWVVAKAESFAVPFVIGADGHSSFVRVSQDIDFATVGPTQHFAVFEFQGHPAPAAELVVATTGGTLNAMWPLPAGFCRWSFQLPQYAAPEESRDKDMTKIQIGAERYPQLSTDDLRRLLAERAPWFQSQVGSIRWRLVCRFERRLASSFGRERVWLAGDAAHMTGPVGIQSMNLGLQEGAHLAELAAGVLQQGQPLAAFQAYEQRWLPEWRLLLGVTPGLQAGPQASPWVAQHAADLVACLPASGPDLRTLAGTLGLQPITAR
jgi:2-polyprenyl-6-methoxyphenol hydroxylase-like FAD-dependent oxidoreductase